MAEIFELTKPLWEIAVRETVAYFALILLVRGIPKRNAGNISPNDMLTPIEHGRLVRRNMRREMVTEEELMAVLRKQGFDDVSSVRSACLEADGEISVGAGDGSREG